MAVGSAHALIDVEQQGLFEGPSGIPPSDGGGGGDGDGGDDDGDGDDGVDDDGDDDGDGDNGDDDDNINKNGVILMITTTRM